MEIIAQPESAGNSHQPPSSKEARAPNSQPILGSRVSCAWCGYSFRRQRLAQRFCSPKCQKTGRLAELAAGAPRSRTRSSDTAVGGFSPKKTSTISTLQKAVARSRVEIIAPADVLATEVFDRTWQAAVSSDGVALEVGKLRQRALVGQRETGPIR